MSSSDSKVLNVPMVFSKRLPFPAMSKPDPIGYFSINSERKFQDDSGSMRYLSRLRVAPLDLNAGIERAQHKSHDPEMFGVQVICQYIYNHQELLRSTKGGELELDADFVTWRGILRKVMVTPYEKFHDYRLLATRLNGTIYIAMVETEMDRADREGMSKTQQDMCSWGFKFEQYCLSHAPDVEPDTTGPVIEGQEFNCIFRTMMDNCKLFYSAEMDGVKSDKAVDLGAPEVLRSVEFVELKTTVNPTNARQQRTFDNFKSLNWWAQSFLVGIETIVAGMRDQNGIVQEIKEFKVRDLASQKPWSAAVTATYLKNFLQKLKSLLEQIDDSNAVAQIDYDPRGRRLTYQVLNGPHAPEILPLWYRQLMRGTSQGPH